MEGVGGERQAEIRERERGARAGVERNADKEKKRKRERDLRSPADKTSKEAEKREVQWRQTGPGKTLNRTKADDLRREEPSRRRALV